MRGRPAALPPKVKRQPLLPPANPTSRSQDSQQQKRQPEMPTLTLAGRGPSSSIRLIRSASSRVSRWPYLHQVRPGQACT